MSASDVSYEGRSLDDWLSYLETIHPVTIDLGLERMLKAASALGILPLRAGKIATVTGTNGKGTVSTLIADAGRLKGLKVAAYNSPHLLRFNERLTIGRRLATDEEFIKAFSRVEKVRIELGITLTFFEFTTLAAFLIVNEYDPDLLVLEVGMGGRLDSTNIVDAHVAAITNVAIDHCAFLGNTRDEIAFEKAGIVKDGAVCVFGESDVPVAVKERCKNANAGLLALGRDFGIRISDRETGAGEYYLFGGDGRASPDRKIKIGFIPPSNAAVALASIAELGITLTDAEIQKLFSEFSLPGRMQKLSEDPLVIADVAHNPHAFEYLRMRLGLLRKKISQSSKIYAVIGMLRDKDFSHALEKLDPEIDGYFLCGLSGERGMTAETLYAGLSEDAKKKVLSLHADPAEAMAAALTRASSCDVVFAAGSFHTAAGVLEYFESMSADAGNKDIVSK